MSYSTYILCQAEEPVSRQKIADFIRDGVYFEDEPRYDPSPPTGNLGRLSICFDPRRAPIIVERLESDEAAGAIEEALDATGRARLPEYRGEEARQRVVQEIRQHIQLTRDVIRFEFDRDALTEDAWVMLDSIENEIIKEGDGILYAYEYGFYGASLKVMARIRK